MSESEQEVNELEQYQQNLLNLFDLDKFDETKIVECIDTVYNKLEHNNYMNEQVKKKLSIKAQDLHSNDPRFGFLLLYSLDNYNIYHIMIQCAIREEITPDEFIQQFMKNP